MLKNPKQFLPMSLAIFFSALMLILFLFLKSRDYLFMDLDVKWIGVAGLPILLSLFFGGYIKTFEGFGVKLESNLKNQHAIDIIATVDSVDQSQESASKGTEDYLEMLLRQGANKIERLRFTNRSTSYNTETASHYFTTLHNLKYVEIVNSRGQFSYLIPSSIFFSKSKPYIPAISSLIETIKSGDFEGKFPYIIENSVFAGDNIVDVYKKVVSSRFDGGTNSGDYFLPVTDKSKIMIGIVYKSALEEKISQEVVKVIK